jgi:hypothetical protein
MPRKVTLNFPAEELKPIYGNMPVGFISIYRFVHHFIVVNQTIIAEG